MVSSCGAYGKIATMSARTDAAMFELNHPVIDVAIICSDFDASLNFYRDLLGLQPVLDIDIPAETARGANLAPDGFRQVRLKAGQTLIKLVEVASPPYPMP